MECLTRFTGIGLTVLNVACGSGLADGSHEPASLGWTKVFASSSEGFASAAAFATHPSGDLLLTGSYTGTLRFDAATDLGASSAAGYSQIFVASFDPTGAHRWSRGFGDQQHNSWGRGIAVGADGVAVITGSFGGTIHFGATQLSATPYTKLTTSLLVGNDIFVAGLDADGATRWASGFGDRDIDQGNAVAVEVSGDVYATGAFAGTVDFGGSSSSPETSAARSTAVPDRSRARLRMARRSAKVTCCSRASPAQANRAGRRRLGARGRTAPTASRWHPRAAFTSPETSTARSTSARGR